MALAGVISDRIKGLIPITWDALKNDVRVGEIPLQLAIDLAKESVTGTVVAETQEQNYPYVVVDFIAKTAVVEMAPMGIDFWMNKSISTSSTGTNENVAYTDRANVLAQLRDQLSTEIRLKTQEVAKMVNYWIDNGRAVPQMSSASINPYHLTPSPEEYPRPFRQTQYS